MFPRFKTSRKCSRDENGGLAQMVERVLSMHEVPGSMPGYSKFIFVFVGNECLLVPKCLPESKSCVNGGLAQMVQRALSKHEVPGSMPGSSTLIFLFLVMNVCWFQNVCEN